MATDGHTEFSRRDFAAFVVLGLAGGLIGFGLHGTATAACMGAGVGLLVIPTLLVASWLIP